MMPEIIDGQFSLNEQERIFFTERRSAPLTAKQLNPMARAETIHYLTNHRHLALHSI
jgi:hypothetical protein